MMVHSQKAPCLTVSCQPDRAEMGRAAAGLVHDRLLWLLGQQEQVNMLFAAAPSQNEFLDALCSFSDVPWQRVNALHMDEYIGLPRQAPQRFGQFLRRAVFDRLPFRTVHYLDGDAPDPEAECARYAALLEQYPLDIACTGIGENGHIAFNDPAVADFHDPKAVKQVALDERCRMQQVHDGCFATLEAVPRHAFTLTVPAILRSGFIVCVVPGRAKAQAVRETLYGPVSEACPASILRTHPQAHLYLEPESAALL
ncbi:glucosamine-6-phosphate deaminase [Flavonifractor hominis]|uniref:Glucosamine-6-phosphate deaminase n=1 Tax=Flavonifractor hominis TaxID=3133178 RepID=A0ABV1ERU4_9FIRM